MNFEWDEAKSVVCLQERGFDFSYASRAFFGSKRVIHADTRYSYGEDRCQLMGRIEQRLFFVTYTQRHDVIPFPDRQEIRREAADSALARQGEATTYRIDLEME